MDKAYIVALYIRISVEDENSREGIRDESNSVTNQRDLLRSYVEHCPEFENCEVLELCDDGFSGTNMERPGVEELLRKARKKEIDCIIVKDFSRFGRDYIMVSDYVDQIFPFLGIRFISVNDNYDSARMRGETSGVDIAFRNVIYSYYSKDLSMKVKSGMRTKALKGDYLSPFAPIGYRKDEKNKNQLVVDESSAGIVRRIFEMAGMGMSVLEIVRLFNAENVPTPKTIKNRQGCHHKWWRRVEGVDLWNEHEVINILRDERYLGKNVYGKRYRPQAGSQRTLKNSRQDWAVVENRHEPLVTIEEFQAAQDHIAEYTEKDIKRPGVHLFTNKLRCGHCGYALAKRRQSAPQFYCRTKYRAKGFGCMEGSIGESEIAEVVLAAIQTYIRVMLDENSLLIKPGNSDRLANLQKKVAAYQDAGTNIAERKAELYDDMVEGKISREQYKRERDKLSKEQEDIMRQAKTAETELVELRGKLAAVKQGKPKLMQYLQTDSLTRQMVVDFVECIYVYNDKSIRIEWRFSEKGENNEPA